MLKIYFSFVRGGGGYGKIQQFLTLITINGSCNRITINRICNSIAINGRCNRIVPHFDIFFILIGHFDCSKHVRQILTKGMHIHCRTGEQKSLLIKSK